MLRDKPSVSKRPSRSRADLDGEKYGERIINIERRIAIAKLEKQLIQIESSPEFIKEVSEAEKIEKDYEELETRFIGIRIFERRKRAEYVEVGKDNPKLLEDLNMTMDEFVRRHGLEPQPLIKKEPSDGSFAG